MKWRPRKYIVLPLVLVPALVTQAAASALAESLTYVILLSVFVIVFNLRWERLAGLTIGLLAIAANSTSHFCHDGQRLLAIVIYHALVIVFLAFAVATILRNIFQSRKIRYDHLVGAFSGFLLTGIIWGNVYLVIDLLAPGSFNIRPEVASQLEDEGMRRFMFNHMSFVILTGSGSGDMTPRTPLPCTLSWLESMFGQFYLAVYIGQLIGLRLARGATS